MTIVNPIIFTIIGSVVGSIFGVLISKEIQELAEQNRIADIIFIIALILLILFKIIL
jgi:hypothetical protein